MNQPVISVEHLSKKYNLGVISTGTLTRDLNKWWARWRGKPDPYAIIGEADYGNRHGDSILALDDVSFTVEQGEVLGIIGANGAGKSTLLKILSQVTAPTSGVVKVKGRIGSLLEVGTGFHPELTGRENVYLNGAILGMRKDEVDHKFDEIVDFSGVEQFIDTPVKRYSSGMYVRLAFAVAAHLDPDILIVDEVLAVGDAEFQKKCLGKMSDIAAVGRTVIFVSHNMTAISSLCTKGIFLDNGMVYYRGTAKEAISKYLNDQFFTDYGDIDLTKAIRRNSLENSKFKWTRARVINSKGIETTSINMLEPFELVLSAFASEPIRDLIVGFGVMSQLGIVLFNSHSVDQNIRKNYESGSIEFIIRFNKNFLGPGSYTIDLGANGPQIVDWIPEAINITINEITSDGGSLTRTNYSGVILHPCEWSVHKMESLNPKY